MKHIKSLENFGKGKRCLIIGGGLSIETFDFANLPDDLYYICTNKHCISMANMIVYYDRDMMKYYAEHDIADDTVLIAFKHKSADHTCKRCNYYYNYDDVYFDKSIGDTGFHTLRFADEIFNFDEIYLIGYDYYVLKEKYHGDTGSDNPAYIENFKTHSIGRVLPKYDNVKWKHKIYNCSKGSKLKKFKYGYPT